MCIHMYMYVGLLYMHTHTHTHTQSGAGESGAGEEVEVMGVLEAVQRLVQELTVVLSSLDQGSLTQLPQQVYKYTHVHNKACYKFTKLLFHVLRP